MRRDVQSLITGKEICWPFFRRNGANNKAKSGVDGAALALERLKAPSHGTRSSCFVPLFVSRKGNCGRNGSGGSNNHSYVNATVLLVGRSGSDKASNLHLRALPKGRSLWPAPLIGHRFVPYKQPLPHPHSFAPAEVALAIRKRSPPPAPEERDGMSFQPRHNCTMAQLSSASTLSLTCPTSRTNISA
jgi:hypothetical protein